MGAGTPQHKDNTDSNMKFEGAARTMQWNPYFLWIWGWKPTYAFIGGTGFDPRILAEVFNYLKTQFV